MIRFRRLFELTSDVDRRRFAEATELFRAAFPHEADAIDRIAHMLLNRQTIGFDPIFLLSTDARDRITGLAFVYYFSDLNYGYLQYIASDPRKPARGIGVALYEALRELLSARGARGLFLDVPPTEPSKLKEPSRLATNRKRMRFYSRYDVRKVADTRGTLRQIPATRDILRRCSTTRWGGDPTCRSATRAASCGASSWSSTPSRATTRSLHASSARLAIP